MARLLRPASAVRLRGARHESSGGSGADKLTPMNCLGEMMRHRARAAVGVGRTDRRKPRECCSSGAARPRNCLRSR